MLFSSFLGAAIAIGLNNFFSKGAKTYKIIGQDSNLQQLLQDTNLSKGGQMNFVLAANAVRPAVVHIKTKYKPFGIRYRNRNVPQYDYHSPFFDGDMPQESSGSGVIISADGYIVTNEHVVGDATEIEVIMDNKRSYTAQLIGRDGSTDLALIKVEENNLPFLSYGNSDVLQVGEWVLAVGNPFDLTFTVTAGIVSAKARSINIIRQKDRLAVESFIQTDAVVNPGNSGGALVNLKGELVGINTAIASTTGFYSGYSFAVPVSLVKKVITDLKEFGTVQRALLGVVITDLTAELAAQKRLDIISGVYVSAIGENSAATEAGIQAGDVILKINEKPVNTTSELQEAVAQFRPGDKVNVTFYRNGVTKSATVVLKNQAGTTDISLKQESTTTLEVEELGAVLRELTAEEKAKLRIKAGIKVEDIGVGKLQEAGVEEGFIITSIDNKVVKDLKDIQKIIANKTGGVLLEGIYPNGNKAYYAFGW
jgi:Do/DeqQ family serine protease